MRFEPGLKEGIFLRRYKRFLADLKVGNQILTVHCANTGAMHGCADQGCKAWYSISNNPKRKLPGSLEYVETSEQHKVCVNTARANALVHEAIQCDQIPEVAEHSNWSREVSIPGERGRFDFGADNLMMEVKMVSWLRNGMGVFPDAQSSRATRHMQALQRCAEQGIRAILFFCVPHSGIVRMTTAGDVDPKYEVAVLEAMQAGVEVLAFRWTITPREWTLDRQIPFEAPLYR